MLNLCGLEIFSCGAIHFHGVALNEDYVACDILPYVWDGIRTDFYKNPKG